MRGGRLFVGVLGGGAATLAFIVGAVSLTRIAGDYLGFPPGLEWTLTGAVDVAGIAGGIMWTAFTGPVRRIGRPMNIVCTVVSGVGVGLDHATHAGRAVPQPGAVWPWVAFAAGLFVPALATWILHSLAVIADAAVGEATTGGRHGDADGQATHTLAVTTPRTPPPPAITTPNESRHAVGPDGQQERATPAAPRPARALASVPPPRPRWMTEHLIGRVVAARRADGSYGRGQIVKDHGLTPAKARALITYIDDHDLMRVWSA